MSYCANSNNISPLKLKPFKNSARSSSSSQNSPQLLKFNTKNDYSNSPMKISPCKYANHSKNLSANTLNSYISSRRSAMKRQD